MFSYFGNYQSMPSPYIMLCFGNYLFKCTFIVWKCFGLDYKEVCRKRYVVVFFKKYYFCVHNKFQSQTMRLEFVIPKTWNKRGRDPIFLWIRNKLAMFIIQRMELLFGRKRGKLLYKVCWYGYLSPHDIYDNASLIKPISIIKHLGCS